MPLLSYPTAVAADGVVFSLFIYLLIARRNRPVAAHNNIHFKHRRVQYHLMMMMMMMTTLFTSPLNCCLLQQQQHQVLISSEL